MTLRKVRVLHVAVGLDWGGAEKLMAELAARTDPSKYSVEVLALKSWGPVGDELRRSGVKVTTLGGSAGLRDWTLGLRLRRFLRENSFQIVHSHLYWANVLTALFKNGESLLWHIHETGPGMPFWRRKLERALLPKTDQIIAISEAVRRSVVERVPAAAGRIVVVSNGVPIPPVGRPFDSDKAEIQRRMFGFSSPGPLVGFVGRLDDPVKGISVLLDAARLLLKERPDVRFVIVGDGRDRALLESRSQQAGISSSVVFTGARPVSNELLSGFDLLAAPSLHEGMGMVLLEAMGASLPVVATRAGGIPEVVVDGETGILAPPGNAESLATALRAVLEDRDKARRMGENGRRRVDRLFSIDRCVRDVERVYSACRIPA